MEQHPRRRWSVRTAGIAPYAALVVVALGTSGCTGPGEAGPGAGRNPSATTATGTATTTTGGATTSMATPTTTRTSLPRATTAAPPAVLHPGAPSGGTRPVPVRLTDSVRAQLVAAYVADSGYRSSWVSGLRPGTSYYAVDPVTGVQLAWVTFEASPSAPERVLVALQDEGSRTALQRVPGGSWRVYDICRTPGFLALTGGVLPAGGRCPTP